MRHGCLGLCATVLFTTSLLAQEGSEALGVPKESAPSAASGLPMGGDAGCAVEPRCVAAPEVCYPPWRAWVTAEFLLWWTKSYNVPPLVTTGPAVFPVGAIGAPGTVILSDNTQNGGLWPGGRFTAGAWLNDCHTCGLEGSFFFLGQNSNTENFGGDVLARPFTAANPGLGNIAELVAFPGNLSGNIAVNNKGSLWGGNINAIKSLCCCCNYNIALSGGFTYMDLEESLTITETIQVSPTSPLFPAFRGDTIVVSDQFGTRNQFYGGNVGLVGWWGRGRTFFNTRGSIAMGSTHQVVDVSGFQRVTTPAGVTTNFNGGLLALPSNSGHFSRDVFSVIPQINFNVGYQVTRNFQVFVGYTFLYWSNVVRPGDQIDTTLDVNQIPNFGVVAPPANPIRPIMPFRDTDFWAQGINFGAGFVW